MQWPTPLLQFFLPAGTSTYVSVNLFSILSPSTIGRFDVVGGRIRAVTALIVSNCSTFFEHLNNPNIQAVTALTQLGLLSCF
jgi:hypothetical protein